MCIRDSIFPGVPELLADLRETGLPFGVVTSKRHEAAVRGLATFGLDGAFDLLIGSDDCAAHKPDPGPVLQGCRQLGLRPEECAYVGDSPFDLQAGRGAGCPTAAVLWGMFPEEVLLAEKPEVACRNVEAVSYTHLDVYKRQCWACRGRASASRGAARDSA